MKRTPEELAAAVAKWKAKTYPVTMAQARKALRRGGITPSMVEASINALPDSTAKDDALDDWEYSTTVSRNSALVTSLGTSLGLTDDQIDDLFVLAATL